MATVRTSDQVIPNDSTTAVDQLPAAAHNSDDDDSGEDIAVTLASSRREHRTTPPGAGAGAETRASARAREGDGVVLYKRRFAMLAMFAMLGFQQCSVWNTWGPIAGTAVEAYPALTSTSVATFAFWGLLTGITGTVLCTLLLQRKGLRFCIVLSTILMTIATSLRCITQDPSAFVLTCHFCAMLNGFAGVVVGIAPALLSSLWFPLSFRTTATGIGCTFNQLGSAGGFFFGPLMVPSPDTDGIRLERAVDMINMKRFIDASTIYGSGNITNGSNLNTLIQDAKDNLEIDIYYLGGETFSSYSSVHKAFQKMQNRPGFGEFNHGKRDWQSYISARRRYQKSIRNMKVSPEVQANLRNSIWNYMIIGAGLSAGLMVIVAAFFEDRPPTPPVPATLPPRPARPSFSTRRSSSVSSDTGSDDRGDANNDEGSRDHRGDHDVFHINQPAFHADPTVAHTDSTVPNTDPYIAQTPDVELQLDSDSDYNSDAPQRDRTCQEIMLLFFHTFRNPSFLLLLLAYSLTLGISVGWSSVLEINLAPFGISQHEASWVGVYITLGGVSLAILMSRFSDYLFGYLKLSIICLMLVATCSYLWFLLQAAGCMHLSQWQLQASLCIAGSFNYAVSPLFFELAMEIGHPTPEDVIGCIMTLSWNLCGVVFLFIMGLSGHVDTIKEVIWMDYILVAQAVMVVALMLFVKESYKRSGAIMEARRREEEAAATAAREGEEDERQGSEAPQEESWGNSEGDQVRLLVESSSSDDQISPTVRRVV